MMKNVALAVALTLLPAAGLAQTSPVHPPSAEVSPILNPADARSDYDCLRHALEEAHPGLYRYSAKALMDRTFDAQRARLDHAMTRLELFEVVAETISQIRCGHTHVQLDDQTEAAMKSARKFPLRVHIEGKRLVVLLNDTSDDRTFRPGMEILEINGRTVPDIYGRLWPTLSADGDIETGKWHDLEGGFARLYWMMIEQPAEFTIKAMDEAGNAVTGKLAGVTDADRKNNHNPVNAAVLAGIGKLIGWSDEILAMRFLKDPQIAEIRLRYFVGENYRKWLDDTFQVLHDKGTKTLIIDLRGNGGGDDNYVAALVSHLTDKPFRFYDHINLKTVTPSFKDHLDLHLSAERLKEFHDELVPNSGGGYSLTIRLHEGLAEQQPAKNAFLGKVFVLTDGGSFSGAGDFCAIVHHLKRATFIGEETGGGYYGNNSGMMPTLTLPNSKIGIRLPFYAYWNAVPGYEHPRRGTLPDYPVTMRIADILGGTDAALEEAVKLADGTSRPRP